MTARVLITGGAGMVGRNLTGHAAASKYEILAPGRSELDLRDECGCFALIRKFRPDLIIHAAGKVGGIQANIADPVGFLVDNFDIGRNIVMAARRAEVPGLLNLGSSCMYPRDAENPLDEDSLLSGPLESTNEGYALAKSAVARLCEYVSRTDGLMYRTAIPCNLFGPYDKFDPAVSHLVPGIISKVHRALRDGSREVEIWGDGSARREFMYSADLADGIWHLADKLDEMPGIVNLGVGNDRTVLEYYQAVAEAVGWRGRFSFNLERPVGVRRKLVSISRQTALGWSPSTSLREGIALTYQYFLGLPEAG